MFQNQKVFWTKRQSKGKNTPSLIANYHFLHYSGAITFRCSCSPPPPPTHTISFFVPVLSWGIIEYTSTKGFKSYNNTRWTSNNISWYNWVERDRNMMRRITLSEKVLEWICFILREASTDQKNLVRRWRYKDQVAEFLVLGNIMLIGDTWAFYHLRERTDQLSLNALHRRWWRSRTKRHKCAFCKGGCRQ